MKAMIFETLDLLQKGLEGILAVDGEHVTVLDEAKFRASLIDDLI
jgi:hypothetical protein